MNFIVRLLINAAALAVISFFNVAGIHAHGLQPLFIGAVVLGLLNAIVRPILIAVSCPLEILSLGLFTLVINGFIFYIGLKYIPGWAVPGYWAAFWGALLMSIVSWILSLVLGEGRREAAAR